MNRIALVFLTILTFSCQRDQRGLIVGKIQKASKLTTTEFTIDKLVHGTKTKRLAWFVNLNEATFLAYTQAVIKAGVDLEKLSIDDVQINETSISIKLPPVEIINFSYPPESFIVDEFVTDNAFLNRISIYDQEKFFRDAEIDIRNNLKYMNIEETTENKTRLMLTGMLRTLGYESVEISFKDSEGKPLIEEIPIMEQFE